MQAIMAVLPVLPGTDVCYITAHALQINLCVKQVLSLKYPFSLFHLCVL